MRTWRLFGGNLVLAGAVALAGSCSLAPAADLPHKTLQGVNNDGSPAYSQSGFPVVMRGVLLNRPSDMLDTTANFIPWNGGAGAFQLGAQWQVFFQSVAPDDFGGTAIYAAQNYGNFPWVASDSDSYSNVEWNAELERLNPGNTLQPGDLIEVHANIGSPYGGKFNLNENHDKDPSADFTITVVTPNHGLPVPQTIQLSDVKDGADQFLFDSTRATGNEHYQGSLVRLENVSLVSSDWDPVTNMVAVSDGEGRTFQIHKGVNPDFDTYALPSGTFDVIGIFNQESTNNQNGYEIWAMHPRDLQMPGDANGDRLTDGADYTIWADNFLDATTPKGLWAAGDFTGDGIVDAADYTVWADHFSPAATLAAVPEPSSLLLAAVGAGLLLACRRGKRS